MSLSIVFLTAVSCGKGSTGSYSAGGLSSATVTAPTPNATTVEILGQQGASSFFPNPLTGTQGMMVLWHNADSTTHRIVLNDNSLDTGLISPGGSSAATTLNVTSAGYHCLIHPAMVGTITLSASATKIASR